MSFDLYFCDSRKSRLDVARIELYMKRLEHTSEIRADDGKLVQFEYSNPVTGVYSLFELPTGAEVGQEESGGLPDGLVSTHLTVSINFLRPHFFALEVMPIVSRLADSLGLSLYDPQEDRVYTQGTESDVLIRSWIKHNDRVTRSVAHDKEPIRMPYLPREESLYWWEYTRARDDYQSDLGDDIFVPSIMLMVDVSDRVKLTVIWSAEVQRRGLWSRLLVPLPQVFPRCDSLMLVWGKSEARHLTKAIVPYPTVMDSMMELLKEIDGPVAGLRVLRPEHQLEASKVFSALPKSNLGSLKVISLGDFVDVLTD